MTKIVETMKKVFGSTGKLVFALFLAGIGVLAVIEGYSSATKFFLKKSLDRYAVVTPWTDDLSILGLNVEGKRKYVGGALVVTLEFKGSPNFLSDPVLNKKNKEESRGFLLRLQDADGFNVVTADIPLTSFTTLVGADSKPIGLRGQHREFMDVEEYARISTVDISWTLDTEIPKPIAQQFRATPRADDSAIGDHCAPGISRAVRLKRLAQYGDVRIAGDDTYKAGGRTVMFGYDGGVIYCN